MVKRKTRCHGSTTAPKKARATGTDEPPLSVAFLRAVNVGGRTVKMDVIAEHFRAMGFTRVSTFLASGNVIFQVNGGDDIEGHIERYLAEHVGFSIPVMVRSKAAMEDVLRYIDGHTPPEATTVHAMFAKTVLSDNQETIASAWATESDSFARATIDTLVWFAETTMSNSPCFNKPFEKLLGVPLTLRNANTVRRLLAKMV
ncbi:hypothetical protein ACHHYP_04233 [Achlya hypogyna]|uniref:DUF1697 domain-containing protein n=1 Tax=Achlya hypogyna TaxID=1202772 RepID=A0A1V9ZPC3_ACHHY|nr:hypothetical protein ACHHYP_04233 [Achlya hypogyna]